MQTRFFAQLASGALLLLFSSASAHAGSATWQLNPTSGDWQTASNWDPATVPNGPTDTATFGASNISDVSSKGFELDALVFNPGASAFTITAKFGAGTQNFSGTGVINNSGVTQKIVCDSTGVPGDHAVVTFQSSATAGNDVEYTLRSNPIGGDGAWLIIAGSGGSATFIGEGAAKNGGAGGLLVFSGPGTAGEATIVNGAGTSTGKRNSLGATCSFNDGSNAGNATITNKGGLRKTQLGGITFFGLDASAANATVIAERGVNGGPGGEIRFVSNSAGGTARLKMFGNGKLEFFEHNVGMKITTGSIEGDGIIDLGTKSLSVGANNLSTTFSGTIMGVNGRLTKIGDSTLTLSGTASTYTGGTTVSAGTLVVANPTGSATGTGGVQVNGGTLGGNGTIPAAVTLGTGSGHGAFLAPAHETTMPQTLTILSGLTLQADATYACSFKAGGTKVRHDEVVANGVTIDSGALFSLQGTGALSMGTVFVVIDNTSAAPIAGAFSNLPDGTVLTVNGNNFQADYEGGDGNDLALTVVP